MPVRLNSSGGGSVTLDVPSTGSAFTMTLPAANGNLGINLGTAQASTSGTAIDFTGIPAGVRRVTVLFNNVSTNGTADYLVQIGSGSFLTSGYNSYAMNFGGGGGSGAAFTNGFAIRVQDASRTLSGMMTLVVVTGNTWASQHSFGSGTTTDGYFGGGGVSLSGTLDRVRVTNGGGNTFDSGTINIAWEF